MEDGPVTQLLNQWGRGDRAAFDQLLPLVYRELHKIAKRSLSKHSPNHTLQTTAVIHEAYLKLAGAAEQNLESRLHFFNVAAKAMRQVLIDYARRSRAAKRGGELRILPIDHDLDFAEEQAHEISALDEALNVLAESFPRQASVVELRYFGGLKVDEAAEALGLSAQTVERDSRFAKSFLKREMQRGSTANPTL